MKSARTLLHAAGPVGLLAVCLLCTGCVGVLPLPVSTTKVERGHRLTQDQVAFLRPGHTARAEVILQLGTNYLSLPRERAMAYSWEMKGGGGVWWYIIGCTVGGAADGGSWTGGWQAYFVAFDEHGVVTARAFKSPSTRHSLSLHEHLDAWVNGLPANRPIASSR